MLSCNSTLCKLSRKPLQIRIMTIHLIMRQEIETCPASKQIMKYNNRNEKEFPA